MEHLMEPIIITNYMYEVEKILTTVDNGAGTGMLKLGDVEWRAVSDDGSVIPEGTLVVIKKIEGTKLFVRRELPTEFRD